MIKIKKIIYLIIGLIALVFGIIGAIIPVLPTTPFLLLSLYAFARSSERLHKWFLGTGLYKDNLESLVKERGMTLKAKFRAMITITLLMTLAFIMMHGLMIGRIILILIWFFHLYYFVFVIQTIDCKKREGSKIINPKSIDRMEELQ